MPTDRDTDTTADTVIGTWNTHRGRALPALPGLLARARDLDVLALQEVLTEASLLRAIPRADRDWHIFTGQRPSLPALLVRRVEWLKVVDHGVDPLPEGRHNRARVWARLHDERVDRDLYVTSVHTDPLGLGLVDANPHARAMHMRQTQAIADATAARPDAAVVVDAGDWNERLAEAVPVEWRPKSALGRMAAAGSRPAFRELEEGDRTVRLDDVLVRRAPFVRVRRRRLLEVAHPESDHDAIVVRLRITRRDADV